MKSYQSILILLLMILPLLLFPNAVEGGKRKIHITDDLDDVVDDEEDEVWKEWGKKKSSQEFDPPPSDFDKMELSQIQEEIMKRHTGPAFGFVKLRLGIPRDKNMVAEIALKWTQLLRTGALGVKFMGIDLGTIMFNVEDGHKVLELKEFILSQDDAYEIKIGDKVYRRAGDPPIEVVAEKLRQSKKNEEHVKEEL
ncbi:Mesoderm development candidate 2 [Gossypium australe]|uniref:Mesoderm development candidate 2 n=1 Tax=Gossypium australe TaxID=47621 RepID=A0A5B6URT3_9ROSI|nr:Mesoderm development candidate 2 [Gossypium australe]